MKLKNQIVFGVMLATLLLSVNASAQIKIIAEPNEAVPRTVYVSNDSLSMTISINDKLAP